MSVAQLRNMLLLRPQRKPSAILWWVVVLLLVEPIVCQWICQPAPHSHRSVHLLMQPTADAGTGSTFVTIPLVRTWICMFGDPLPPNDPQQPISALTPLHDHHAIATVLPALVAMLILLVPFAPPILRPLCGITAPIDRPPILLQ